VQNVAIFIMGAQQSNEAVAPEGSGSCYGVWGAPRGTEHSAEHDASDSPLTQTASKVKKNVSFALNQKELNRCQDNLDTLTAWIEQQKEQDEECIRTVDHDVLLDELEKAKNRYVEHLQTLKDAVAKNDPKWKHHMKHLDMLFGKAEKFNEDLDRRNRLQKTHSIKSARLGSDAIIVGISNDHDATPSGEVTLPTPNFGSSDSDSDDSTLKPHDDFTFDDQLINALRGKSIEDIWEVAKKNSEIMNKFKGLVAHMEKNEKQSQESDSESESSDKVLDRDEGMNLNGGGRKEKTAKSDPGLSPKQLTSSKRSPGLFPGPSNSKLKETVVKDIVVAPKRKNLLADIQKGRQLKKAVVKKKPSRKSMLDGIRSGVQLRKTKEQDKSNNPKRKKSAAIGVDLDPINRESAQETIGEWVQDQLKTRRETMGIQDDSSDSDTQVSGWSDDQADG